MDLVGFVQTVASGVLTGGVYAMVGIGLSLIFGVMRIVNFAHGEFMAVGMYIAFALFRSLHVDPYLSLVVVAPAGFLLGAFVERVLLAPIQNAAEHSLILMTVGVGLILSNALLLIFGAHPETIYTSYSTRTIRIAAITLSVPLLVSFALTVIVVAALFFVLTRTDLGRAIRGAAQNRDAAELQGVDTRFVQTAVFGIGIVLSMAAGVLLLPALYVFPTVGGIFTLKAFVVTVLGGMGSVVGAIWGGLLLGIVESVGAGLGATGYRDAFGLVAFLLVLLVRPQGLFGTSRV
ncbi:MAG TPA: branched-chain amino acid ABC transporter permease [Myxococcales bacterium]|nr:branched-chain amino acid ABC transporter permease [Myxococcales bacterium]